MIKIVQVLEIDGKQYVPLEDYQKLLGEYEKTQQTAINAEIIAVTGKDEVYSE